MTTISLNYDQIISEAESFTSPYDATSEEQLNLMAYNGERVLNQLKALKYAMDADDTSTYANKAVRVFACTKQIENMLLVIEDARGDLAKV